MSTQGAARRRTVPTGLDHRPPIAMYVGKCVSGVLAAQTLSRVNRTYRTPSGVRKDVTFALTFVNAPEEIRESVEPCHTDATGDDDRPEPRPRHLRHARPMPRRSVVSDGVAADWDSRRWPRDHAGRKSCRR